MFDPSTIQVLEELLQGDCLVERKTEGIELVSDSNNNFNAVLVASQRSVDNTLFPIGSTVDMVGDPKSLARLNSHDRTSAKARQEPRPPDKTGPVT